VAPGTPSVVDAAMQVPTTSSINPIVGPGPDGDAEEADSGGCSVAPGGSARGSAWLVALSAAGLGAIRRRRRRGTR
jgi:MYXO-CTERM domain-containing protein